MLVSILIFYIIVKLRTWVIWVLRKVADINKLAEFLKRIVAIYLVGNFFKFLKVNKAFSFVFSSFIWMLSYLSLSSKKPLDSYTFLIFVENVFAVLFFVVVTFTNTTLQIYKLRAILVYQLVFYHHKLLIVFVVMLKDFQKQVPFYFKNCSKVFATYL